jgi:hypothetical protein
MRDLDPVPLETICGFDPEKTSVFGSAKIVGKNVSFSI